MEEDWFTKHHRQQRRYLWLIPALFVACVALASTVAAVVSMTRP